MIGEPHEIFVGQFSRVYAFIEGRGGGLRTYEEPGTCSRSSYRERAEPQLRGRRARRAGHGADAARQACTAFHPHRLLPIIDRAASNVVGAVFSSAQPGTYRLICPGQLPRANQDVVLRGAHSVRVPRKGAAARASARRRAGRHTRRTSRPKPSSFEFEGDSSATYALRLPTTGPTAAGSVSGTSATPPPSSRPRSRILEQPVEITARYPANHPVFNGPGQRNASHPAGRGPREPLPDPAREGSQDSGSSPGPHRSRRDHHLLRDADRSRGGCE